MSTKFNTTQVIIFILPTLNTLYMEDIPPSIVYILTCFFYSLVHWYHICTILWLDLRVVTYICIEKCHYTCSEYTRPEDYKVCGTELEGMSEYSIGYLSLCSLTSGIITRGSWSGKSNSLASSANLNKTHWNNSLPKIEVCFALGIPMSICL